VVALLCAAPFLVVLDANLVAIALPSIRDDLDFSRGDLQWVIGAYSLAFGGALLVGGRAADLYGRRRLLVLGLALFSAASLAGATATSRPVLLAARAAQGLGAAAAFPASLALIAALFEPGEARDRALGAYGAVLSAAFVSGMVVGGVLTASAGWRSVLLLEAPVAAGAALATRGLVPAARPAAAGAGLGLPGALAASAAVLTLLYGIGTRAPALATAALFAAAAWRLERRSPAPLVPRALVCRRTMIAAVLAALMTVGTGVGVVFVLTLYLQDVLGYDPVAAGLALTLLGVAGVSSGFVAPRVARRAGMVRTLIGALLVQAAGVTLLVPVEPSGGISLVLAGTALLGLGHFAATVAFTALATAGASDEGHGIAMGVIGSAQQIGGAVGLALLAAIAARTGDADAHEAVVDGFRWALAAGAGMSLLAAVLVVAVTGPPRARRPARGLRTTRPPARSSRR
jgi:MFS family permease